MPIQTSCPSCGKTLRVPDDLLGRNVKCPSCQTQFVASEGAGAAESPPPLPPTEGREAPSGRRPRDDEGYREEAPAPRRSSRRELDRDDDFDDEYDDRPRRRRRDYAPHRGTLILVLGILSLVGCGIFTGIPAWIMGSGDLKQIRAGQMDPEGEQLTNIGRILGMISCILSGVVLLIYCFIFMIAIIGGAAGRK
jgi:hypothetical protein